MKHRLFTKTFALLLAAVLLLTTVSASAFALSAEDGDVRFAVAADVHLRLPDAPLEISYPESELYYSC